MEEEVCTLVAHHDEVVGAEVLAESVERTEWCIADTVEGDVEELADPWLALVDKIRMSL